MNLREWSGYIVFGLVLVSGLSSACGQGRDEADAITGTNAVVFRDLDGAVKILGLIEFRSLARQTVRAVDHGMNVEYSGFDLGSVLELGGLQLDTALRGPRLAEYLLVVAADNYQAVIALPELDSSFGLHRILLVDTKNGQPLPPSEGHWRIVIPDEKRQARWVRKVARLEILRAKE